ncbi:MAG: hypothetical protein ABSC54_00430 [Smithellaceae bacterium]|jgi:hypothetical protein
MNNQTLNVKNSQYKDIPILALMTFILFVIKAIWAVLISSGPTIIDEIVYKFNASAIFALQKYVNVHFPPVYSLALAPALFLKHWYEGMLVINAFWSSLVVPATWFLARSAGIRQPLIAALLAGLLPMHAIYPNMLYSENLFVPFFVLAAALALRGGKRGHVEALAFGFVLGVAHLTKYLFLPSLPIFFGAWLYSRSKSNKEVPLKSFPKRYYPALFVLLAYSLVIGIWLYYGRASGFGWRQLLGFNLYGSITKAANVDSFLMWAVAYTSYIILVWLSVWGIIVIWTSQLSNKAWRIQPETQHWRFLVLVLLLFGCYWLLAVQHSFRAGYNYPVPLRLIGRYLMQLSPIMLVVGVWVLERIAENPAPFRKMKALIGAGVLVGLASISWCILFNKGIWAFSEWFTYREPGTVDVIALVSLPVFLLAIVMVLLLLAMMWLRKNDIRFLVLPIITLMLVSLMVDAGRMHDRQDGLHFRELAYAAASLTDQEGDTVNVFFDSKNLSMQWIETRLLFWGVKQKQISIQDVSTYRNSRLTSSKSLMLLSNKLFDIKPLREYIVNDKPYYIYRIDGLDPKMLRLGILDLDPNSVLFVHH